MCYGFDGTSALRRSLARTGMDRRGMLRGSQLAGVGFAASHVKDRHAANGDMADLGTGMIDFAWIFAGHSVLEYIVENDTPDVTPQQTAEVGYRYLRDLRF